MKINWRNIAITLISLIVSIRVGIPTGVVGVIASLQQLRIAVYRTIMAIA